ncbi:hypothetical protein KIPB_013876, partial [Kipferlia bialata]
CRSPTSTDCAVTETCLLNDGVVEAQQGGGRVA